MSRLALAHQEVSTVHVQGPRDHAPGFGVFDDVQGQALLFHGCVDVVERDDDGVVGDLTGLIESKGRGGETGKVRRYINT